jgi:hypothetical protein
VPFSDPIAGISSAGDLSLWNPHETGVLENYDLPKSEVADNPALQASHPDTGVVVEK